MKNQAVKPLVKKHKVKTSQNITFKGKLRVNTGKLDGILKEPQLLVKLGQEDQVPSSLVKNVIATLAKQNTRAAEQCKAIVTSTPHYTKLRGGTFFNSTSSSFLSPIGLQASKPIHEDTPNNPVIDNERESNSSDSSEICLKKRVSVTSPSEKRNLSVIYVSTDQDTVYNNSSVPKSRRDPVRKVYEKNSPAKHIGDPPPDVRSGVKSKIPVRTASQDQDEAKLCTPNIVPNTHDLRRSGDRSRPVKKQSPSRKGQNQKSQERERTIANRDEPKQCTPNSVPNTHDLRRSGDRSQPVKKQSPSRKGQKQKSQERERTIANRDEPKQCTPNSVPNTHDLRRSGDRSQPVKKQSPSRKGQKQKSQERERTIANRDKQCTPNIVPNTHDLRRSGDRSRSVSVKTKSPSRRVTQSRKGQKHKSQERERTLAKEQGSNNASSIDPQIKYNTRCYKNNVSFTKSMENINNSKDDQLTPRRRSVSAKTPLPDEGTLLSKKSSRVGKRDVKDPDQLIINDSGNNTFTFTRSVESPEKNKSDFVNRTPRQRRIENLADPEDHCDSIPKTGFLNNIGLSPLVGQDTSLEKSAGLHLTKKDNVRTLNRSTMLKAVESRLNSSPTKKPTPLNFILNEIKSKKAAIDAIKSQQQTLASYGQGSVTNNAQNNSSVQSANNKSESEKSLAGNNGINELEKRVSLTAVIEVIKSRNADKETSTSFASKTLQSTNEASPKGPAVVGSIFSKSEMERKMGKWKTIINSAEAFALNPNDTNSIQWSDSSDSMDVSKKRRVSKTPKSLADGSEKDRLFNLKSSKKRSRSLGNRKSTAEMRKSLSDVIGNIKTRTVNKEIQTSGPHHSRSAVSSNAPFLRRSAIRKGLKSRRAVTVAGYDTSSNENSEVERPNIYDSLQEGNELDALGFSDLNEPSVSLVEKPWRFDPDNASLDHCPNVSLGFIRREAEIGYNLNAFKSFTGRRKTQRIPSESGSESGTDIPNDRTLTENVVSPETNFRTSPIKITTSRIRIKKYKNRNTELVDKVPPPSSEGQSFALRSVQKPKDNEIIVHADTLNTDVPVASDQQITQVDGSDQKASSKKAGPLNIPKDSAKESKESRMTNKNKGSNSGKLSMARTILNKPSSEPIAIQTRSSVNKDLFSSKKVLKNRSTRKSINRIKQNNRKTNLVGGNNEMGDISVFETLSFDSSHQKNISIREDSPRVSTSKANPNKKKLTIARKGSTRKKATEGNIDILSSYVEPPLETTLLNRVATRGASTSRKQTKKDNKVSQKQGYNSPKKNSNKENIELEASTPSLNINQPLAATVSDIVTANPPPPLGVRGRRTKQSNDTKYSLGEVNESNILHGEDGRRPQRIRKRVRYHTDIDPKELGLILVLTPKRIRKDSKAKKEGNSTRLSKRGRKSKKVQNSEISNNLLNEIDPQTLEPNNVPENSNESNGLSLESNEDQNVEVPLPSNQTLTPIEERFEEDRRSKNNSVRVTLNPVESQQLTENEIMPPPRVPTSPVRLRVRRDLTQDSGFENSNPKTKYSRKGTIQCSRRTKKLRANDDSSILPTSIGHEESPSPLQPGPLNESESRNEQNDGTDLCSRILDRTSNFSSSHRLAPSDPNHEQNNEYAFDGNVGPQLEDEYIRHVIDGHISRVPTATSFQQLGNLYVFETLKDPENRFSAGYLRLEAGEQKRPNTGFKYSFVYGVISGTAQVHLKDKRNIVTQGESFYIPLGVEYSIKNYSSETNLVLSYTRIKGSG